MAKPKMTVEADGNLILIGIHEGAEGWGGPLTRKQARRLAKKLRAALTR